MRTSSHTVDAAKAAVSFSCLTTYWCLPSMVPNSATIFQVMPASSQFQSSVIPHDHSEAASDLALLGGVQQDCQDCFSLLFHRYCNLVFEIAWRTLRNRGEAEDLLQEVFLSIFEQRYKYDPLRGTVKVWICQFVHFKALMRRRRLTAGHALAYEEAVDFEEGVSAELRKVTDVQAWIWSIESALTQLQPRQRRTIELIHFDGYTLQEASAILNESLANTRNHYYRGMKALRALLLASRHAEGATSQRSGKEVLLSPRPAFHDV
jgi:RNA polymerase sigma-70 factor, ECF subfamily